ncbi:MAG TPA: HAMP domain-containing sensor histidine kinase [bacterium]|nr:HAMP domain-containing sensor histidine kinase [bacterium]
MSSVRGRLVLVLVLVAWLSVAVVGVVTDRLTGSRVQAFLRHERAMPGMGVMMRGMMGPPERRLLGDVRRAIWVAAVIGLGVAAVAGTATARTITAPLDGLAAAAGRLGQGALDLHVPERGGDEFARVARAFNQMAASLRQVEETRRQFLADIAHELGTPLAVLQANVEGILDGVLEASPERLASLHAQTQVLARLVRDLRDLSLAGRGELRLDRQPTDLGAVVRNVVELARPLAEEKHVALEVSGPAVEVAVDRERIVQVLHNLVSNALRYTDSGGRIGVTVRNEGREIVVEVSDTGAGIPADELPRIFDRFHRVDRSRSRDTGGAGLGLAIVKHLVEAHGGRVWARSQIGAGTTVGFALPAAFH